VVDHMPYSLYETLSDCSDERGLSFVLFVVVTKDLGFSRGAFSEHGAVLSWL
jgi:hypothetical protein